MNTTEEKREAIPNSVSRMLITGVGVLLQVLWLCWLAPVSYTHLRPQGGRARRGNGGH